MFCRINAAVHVRTSCLSHGKIRELTGSEFLSYFTQNEALMRHLDALQTSNFAIGKLRCLHTYFRVNWTENIAACFSPPSCAVAHACAQLWRILQTPRFLRNPKAEYLNFNQYRFYDISHLFIWTPLILRDIYGSNKKRVYCYHCYNRHIILLHVVS